jgi:universal stress protein A
MKAKPGKNSGEVVLKVTRCDESLLMAAATTPFSLKNILVPIDFSDCSMKALQYALPLAKQHGAAITLLHIVPALSYAAGEYGNIDYASLESEMLASGEQQLRTLAADHIGGAVRTNLRVQTGAPSIGITESAANLPADLIVISTHGRTGLKHIFLGSVSEHVIRHAPCPVLVVREREREFLLN